MINPDFTTHFAHSGINATITSFEYEQGWWEITASNTMPPSYKQFNTIQHLVDQKMEYLDLRARNIWHSDINYGVGGYALGVDGNLYKATTANSSSEPTTNPSKWDLISEGGAPPASTPLIPMPIGSLVWYAGHNAGGQNGVIYCDGSEVSRTVYAELFAEIGTLYGSGDGSSTFNLPDMRGEFARGFDNARGVDAGRSMGSWQSASGTRNKGLDFLVTGSPLWHRPLVASVDGVETTQALGARLLVDVGVTITETYSHTVIRHQPRNLAMYVFMIYTNT